jgi:type I restriction enzyme S subunit
MIELTFKQTQSELMVRAAATIIFNTLLRYDFPIVSLSSLTEHPQYGFTASASQEFSGVKLVRITDLQDGKISWDTVPYCQCEQPEKYLLQPNDILFARTGATTGKTHLVKEAPAAVFASYLIRVRPKEDGCSDYLYYFFQSDVYWRQIIEEKKGSAQPNVNGQKLMNIDVPMVDNKTQVAISQFLEVVRARQDESVKELPELPPPLNEQGRIVARIEELAAKVEEARGLRRQSADEAKALFNSGKNDLFNEAFTHQWESMALGDIADIRSGVTLGRKLQGATITLPYLRVANVQDGYLDLRSIKKVEILESEIGKWQLQFGDLLLTEGGDWDKLGRGTVWHGEISNCIHQNHIFRVRLNQQEFAPHYLSALIGSPYGKAYFQAASKQTTNLATINHRQLKAFRVFKPPLSEQHRIVTYLDNLQAKVDALKRLQTETAVELDALLPSILDKAFKGEL